MNQAEEDALIQSCDTGAPMSPVHAKAIRLAIRAAVAAERERCAQLCDAFAEELRPYAEREYSRDDAIARDCAAAIRRGDD